MGTVRDKFWIWGHEVGSHDQGWNTPAPSRMTPAEGAFYLGVPNIIMVRYKDLPAPPYEQYAHSFRPLQQFVWSIVGASGVTSDEELDHVRRLAERNPNMTGVMMDDFFRNDPDSAGVHTPEALQRIRDNLTVAGRTLDLWVVLYQQQFDLPIRDHLTQCDVVTFWTWWAERIEQLEDSFTQCEQLAPTSRKVLGCYMWDYGNKRPMPVSLMEKQCNLGLQWLQAGRIDGMIFLANCICDLELETVEWTRNWIQDVGDDLL